MASTIQHLCERISRSKIPSGFEIVDKYIIQCSVCKWQTSSTLKKSHVEFLHKLEQPRCRISKRGSIINRRQAMKQTFDSWPVQPNVNADDMVNNGFYYTGRDTQTKCVECGLLVDNWVEGDNPFEKHKRYNLECILIQNKICNVF